MKTAFIFKKMAAIVAIVGAGLLAAPLEQAQAQTGMPEVTELFLWATEASGYELYYGWDGVSVALDTSSAYSKWDEVDLTPTEDRGNPTSYEVLRGYDYASKR